MRNLSIIILVLFSAAIYGQENKSEFDAHKWEAPYKLPVPKDWTIERFPIPISFAPQISYKGIEDIRFAPGWGKKNNEAYWSYAFLWYLEGEVEINSKIIEHNLKTYFTGLIGVNGRNIPGEKIIPVEASFKEIMKNKDDLKAFVGTIKMTDYMQQKPIVLNCKVHLKSCIGETSTCIFYELSPQPLSHSVWLELDKIWLDFICKKD